MDMSPSENVSSSYEPCGMVMTVPTVLRDRFPFQLFDLLDEAESSGMSAIISWQPHGKLKPVCVQF